MDSINNGSIAEVFWAPPGQAISPQGLLLEEALPTTPPRQPVENPTSAWGASSLLGAAQVTSPRPQAAATLCGLLKTGHISPAPSLPPSPRHDRYRHSCCPFSTTDPPTYPQRPRSGRVFFPVATHSNVTGPPSALSLSTQPDWLVTLCSRSPLGGRREGGPPAMPDGSRALIV